MSGMTLHNINFKKSGLFHVMRIRDLNFARLSRLYVNYVLTEKNDIRIFLWAIFHAVACVGHILRREWE